MFLIRTWFSTWQQEIQVIFCIMALTSFKAPESSAISQWIEPRSSNLLSESSRGYVKTKIIQSTLKDFQLNRVGWGPRICIFNNILGDATAHLGTPLWKSLKWRINTVVTLERILWIRPGNRTWHFHSSQ